ncbi:MAG: hypothetical protein P0Y49_17805 [Candidatus Pedobacter colombiensis]|uniref:Lipocalin-like domain-containing protein n=1 Tax=Candidatus Pedobacter colombiensis TaxID=3121371 RepID=A0AAJ6B6M6_9SPHI|nr:lipocalin family protein [Pedobacter sp.]WEK18646.1 MAG: hypothetical protein P0Y49_17805 [Pedobacter sp.]
MKKQITFAIGLLLIFASLTSCKKNETATLKGKIVGRWQVAKIETTVSGLATVTYTGVAADYFDFRNNDANEVVVAFNGTTYTGIYYVLINDHLNITYNGKTRSAQVTTITANKLEFTASVDGASPQTTEKYYLTR